MVSVSRPRGGSGNCCPDCSETHKACGKAWCIPQFLCVVVERTDTTESTTFGCCRLLETKLAHLCGSDFYTTSTLTCGSMGFTVTAQIIDNGDSYCFKVIVENNLEEVVYLVCDPPEMSLSKQNLTIQAVEYPEEDFVGTIEVTQMSGVPNSQQYGRPGECPNCGPIRVNKATNDPRKRNFETCEEPTVSSSPKVSAETFGDDWEDQLTAGTITEDEFCWFYPPCKCIPDKVCITYTHTNACNERITERKEVYATDCVYSTYFNVCRKSAYGGYGCEDDIVTVTGFINDSCEIVWQVTSSSFDILYTSAMGRVSWGAAEYTKRCGISLATQSIEESAIEGVSGLDEITVDDSCLCVQAGSVDCPSACQGFRAPTPIEVFNTEADRCYRPIVYGTIEQCGELGASFEMHFEGFQFTTNEPRDFSDCPFPEIDGVVINPCQRWLSYNNFILTDPTHALASNPGLVPLGECPDAYDPVSPGSNLYYNTACFELVYPDECDGEVNVSNIYKYRLYYQIDLVCETPSSAEFLQLRGYVHPTSGDCETSELIFEVPITDVGDCSCNCSSLTVRLQATHVPG